MFNSNINVMIWKDNTIGITKSDILSLINIVKNVSSINKDNSIDDDTKDKRVFTTLFLLYHISQALLSQRECLRLTL